MMDRTIEVHSRGYHPYPKYRDSGVEWLGEVPEHWVIWKATHGFRRIGSGTTPKSNDPDYYDGDIPWVTTSELRETVIEDSTIKVTATAMREYPTLRMYPKGTLLFAMYGATIGRLGILGIAATVNQACAALAEPLYLATWFVYYWLQMRRPVLIVLSAGGGQPNLSQDDLRQLRIPAPPLDEQRAIAAFLNRETAKIDALVARKERLIELLQEKRTTLITRAVTRGLDPNVPMKDSGVEWLGEIPAHWEVRQWRYCCHVTEGQVAPDDEQFREKVLIAPNHIESGTGRILHMETADEQGAISGKYLVEPGDIIYSKIRPALNKVCVSAGHWLCSADMYPISITESHLQTRFLLYFMLSKPFVQLMVDESMRVAMPKVNREKLASCPLLVPDPEEQLALADFIDRETARIDSLIAMVREAIDHLKEFRTALISAAVTGKINVGAASD